MSKLPNDCICLFYFHKGWVCDNFPRQYHFFWGTFHEKHKFKYFKNLTVKFGAMMSICLFFSITMEQKKSCS
jgi:hypothetical protein